MVSCLSCLFGYFCSVLLIPVHVKVELSSCCDYRVLWHYNCLGEW